jgi:hypothetical protein
MKIAICSLDIGDEFSKAVEPSQISKKIYCSKHGYDYIDDKSVYDIDRPPAWSKIKLIQKYLPSYDYIIWIDADAMIMDIEQKIEDKIKLMEDNDIMVISPFPRINTGVMFCKNSNFTLEFLQKIYDYDMDVFSGDWEQDAFTNLYDKDLEIQKHIKVLSFHYEKDIQSYWFAYRYGHFILHLCGYRGRNELLGKDLKSWCLVDLPDDVENSLALRVHFMKNNWEMYVNSRL